MAIIVNAKQLQGLLKMNQLSDGEPLKPEKKKRTSIDRLKDATAILNQYPNDDKIFISGDSMILHFDDIALISNNDLLRIDNREIYAFKKAWHERVAHLLKGIDLSDWKTKEIPVVIEFLYMTKNAKTYDPDSIVSAFKSTLDGLVCANVLNDDTVENIPLIIPRQEKSKLCPLRNRKINRLTIVISPALDITRFYSSAFKKITENPDFAK